MYKNEFVVSTANTQYGKAISSPETVQDFVGTDVLLMQEVLNKTPDEVSTILGSIGLRLAGIDTEGGLAIAISDKFNVVDSKTHPIERWSVLSSTARVLGFDQRLRKRSVLVANLEDIDGNRVVVASGHPIVAPRFYKRRNYIKATSKVLANNYPDGNLIYGSDGNHYPSPRKIDKQMAGVSKLRDVSTKDPTVLLSETKHRYLKKVGLKDARLDTLLHRGVEEVTSRIVKIKSDHRAIQAIFKFVERK